MLECLYDLDKRIGKVDGKKLNRQWLLHLDGLVVDRFHFICTGAAQDDIKLKQWEMDADASKTQLESKKRRDLVNWLRRARGFLHDTNI